MPTRTVRPVTSLAALAWIAVGGYGMWEIVVEDSGDDWQTPYAIFSVALFLGMLLTVAAVWIVRRDDEPSVMRNLGYGVCGLAALSAIVAWALPLWMTLAAVGYGLVATAGAAKSRRAVAMLSAAPLLGMAALFVGMAMEVGRRDEYGDHPVAFGIGTLVTAAAMVGALVQLDRSFSADTVAPRSRPGALTS